MALVRRCVIGLLLLFLAYQLAAVARAWRDDAVATSWIEALSGDNTCGRTFTHEEALHFERLATIASSKLTTSEILETDCYIRNRTRLQTLSRALGQKELATRGFSDATIIAAVIAALILIVLLIFRARRQRVLSHD